ncbi:hypothetical protein FFM54_08330 [Burkholderia pseudomallei]|nr:hypothetical protein BOC39_11375 [Burkholderia pseudomallei]ARL39815.1 hypothetical protein BOC49_27330 [Burkholderia pseudomallei]NRE46266.1 hypothetical protein [Burkholderia pseudomallei]QCU49711.1 hypothetical protein FFM54_08330 [Burkholderia pseudomallei]
MEEDDWGRLAERDEWNGRAAHACAPCDAPAALARADAAPATKATLHYAESPENAGTQLHRRWPSRRPAASRAVRRGAAWRVDCRRRARMHRRMDACTNACARGRRLDARACAANAARTG